MRNAAIYAGTFDPLTLGHYDIIQRCATMFDRVILAVAAADAKKTLFSIDERVAVARAAVQGLPHVEVDSFTGLLIDYARQQSITIIVRGLRAFSDFENEFRMALTNRRLAPEVETLFMMTSESHCYVSSSMVKEVALMGGDVSSFLPPATHAALLARFKERKQ